MHRIKQLLSSDNPIKWLFTGDSITQGALHTYTKRDYTQLFSEHIWALRSRYRDVVINTAISGRTSSDVLADFDWGVAQCSPHIVLIMLGMNDADPNKGVPIEKFRENLQELTQKSKALNDCQVVLQTTCPIIKELSPERAPHLANYMDAVREVAAEQGTVLIDHTEHWQQMIEQKPLNRYSWMNDPIHPNGEGHRIFAELLLKELGLNKDQ
jgi:acyl-CoA thioesterase-1